MNNTVFVITVENQYREKWVDRIYTDVEDVRKYLKMNYLFWVNERDRDEEELKEIENYEPSPLTFYMELVRRGCTIEVTVEQLNETPDIV